MTAQRSQRLAQSASVSSAKAQLSPFLRFQKIKSVPLILAAAKHNLRELPPTPNIDAQRSCFNEVLIGPTTAKAVKAQFKSMLAAAGIQKLRKDAVLLIETIVSLPVGMDDSGRQYFKAGLAWLADHFGPGNLLSATLHNDEGAQHMHVLIVPLVNGAMNGSDLLGGPQRIRALQSDFRLAMQTALHALGVQAAVFASCPPKADMAQAVLAHLKNARDPVLRSVAWQPIRDCIERHARLFYEYLSYPPPPPSPGTETAIRPRKRMPTSTEIFTRPVGKLRGSQVEKYRDSEEYKRAHAVYVNREQVVVKENVQQKQRDLRPTLDVALLLTAPPFQLRTLCSVGFTWQQECAASSSLASAVKVSVRMASSQILHVLVTSWLHRQSPFAHLVSAIACSHCQPSLGTAPIAAFLLWRWTAYWPRAPPTAVLLVLNIITREDSP